MADDRSPYRPRIKANAAESILPVAGLRGLRGHRAQTLQRCVKNVEEGRAVVTSLKVLESKSRLHLCGVYWLVRGDLRLSGATPRKHKFLCMEMMKYLVT